MATQRSWGIDVSYHQGVIDWNAVKATGCEWVILRAGYGFRTIDTQFVNNITGAIAAGFENIGVYWFCYSHNTDDIAIEAASCLAALEPYREHINLPVWFDFEGASYTYVQNTYGISLTASQIRDIATAWCTAVTDAGYSAGIYSNRSDGDRWFKLSNGEYLWEHLGCEYWYARYGANNETSLFVVPAFEETALAEHPETNILQYSDVGRVNGINSQRVDLNVRYIDTPEPPTPPPSPPTPDIDTPVGRNSIEYLEIRNTSFEVIGIMDTAKSIIWHSVYFGVGDFEIYISVTQKNLDLLQIGNYVTRTDNREVGIIEAINIANDPQNGLMIAAKGRFAKSILERRLIYKFLGHTNVATILRGNVETNIRQIVTDNAIACVLDARRNISDLALGDVAGITKTIVDADGHATQKQVSYQNLLSYTDEVLEEYGLSSLCILDADNAKLKYIVFEGIDRSATNTVGNMPIVFSQEFDNLTDSTYTFDGTTEKNTALIGGEGEDINRFYSLLAGSETGLARREVWIDASSINMKYRDSNDEEQTYSDADYKAMLDAKGKQDMAAFIAVETFTGTIDVTNGNWVYNRDFALGDIVTVQDNNIGKYVNVRIRGIVEVQDENGYTVSVEYQ